MSKRRGALCSLFLCLSSETDLGQNVFTVCLPPERFPRAKEFLFDDEAESASSISEHHPSWVNRAQVRIVSAAGLSLTHPLLRGCGVWSGGEKEWLGSSSILFLHLRVFIKRGGCESPPSGVAVRTKSLGHVLLAGVYGRTGTWQASLP